MKSSPEEASIEKGLDLKSMAKEASVEKGLDLELTKEATVGERQKRKRRKKKTKHKQSTRGITHVKSSFLVQLRVVFAHSEKGSRSQCVRYLRM